MSQIISHIKHITECSKNEQLECYTLLCKEFVGVRLDDFTKDFNEKEHIILLTDSKNSIVGFSTLMIMDLVVGGKIVKAIFSGDTTVDTNHRNSLGFAIEFAKFFTQTVEKFPDNEIYYVLISKGWRTYRILQFYFKHFVPSPNRATTHYEKMIIEAFGFTKYPDNYHRGSGLILFDGNVQRLRPESTDAKLPTRDDPYVDFFGKKNPDYLKGNELVCIAKVAWENFTPAIARLSHSAKNKEVICKD